MAGTGAPVSRGREVDDTVINTLLVQDGIHYHLSGDRNSPSRVIHSYLWHRWQFKTRENMWVWEAVNCLMHV